MLEALSNPFIMLALMALATAIVFYAKGRRWLAEYRAFQAWRLAGMPSASQGNTSTRPIETGAQFDPEPLVGAGRALKNPPGDFRVMVTHLQAKGPEPYRFPLVWDRGGLNTARFKGDVNHILITGQTDAGKDNVVRGMLLALANQHTPQQVQVAIIDGKGLDWIAWRHKAHTWHLATDPEDIGDAMQALTNERKRRRVILEAAGVSKWDLYEGNNLPLLVVFVSELLLLENAVGKNNLTGWLNTELVAARAFGIRYILATQTASNFSTQWRSQISLFLAGYQPAASQDAPNTGLTTNELKQLGTIPPSELPAPPSGAGVFIAIQGRDNAIGRASYLTDQHVQWVLDQLPNKAQKSLQSLPSSNQQMAPKKLPQTQEDMLLYLLHTNQPLPIESEGATSDVARSDEIKRESVALVAPGSGSAKLSVSATSEALPLPTDEIPEDEQRRILSGAQYAPSRRALCQKLYETTGGQKYRWVQQVCDAAGLLQSKAA